MKSLSDKLKAERQKRGLTQQHMADLLNVHRSTYSLYETGKRIPNLQTLYHFSFTLKLYMGDLISDWTHLSAKQGTRCIKLFISPDELRLLTSYRTLNLSGRQEALKRMEELAELCKYLEHPPKKQ